MDWLNASNRQVVTLHASPCTMGRKREEKRTQLVTAVGTSCVLFSSLFLPWAVGQPLRVPGLVGTATNSRADQALIYRAIAEREGLRNPTAAIDWLRDRGLTAHHTGGDNVILVPRGVHTTQFGGVQHTNVADLPP